MNAAQLKDQIALLENTLAAIDAARAALPDIYKSVSIQSLDASASEAQVKLYREKTKQAYASTSKLKELVAAANPTLDQAVNSFAKDQANVNIKKRARTETATPRPKRTRLLPYPTSLPAPHDTQSLSSFCSDLSQRLGVEIKVSDEASPRNVLVRVEGVLQARIKLHWNEGRVLAEDITCGGFDEIFSWHAPSAYHTFQQVTQVCRTYIRRTMESEPKESNLEEVLASFLFAVKSASELASDLTGLYRFLQDALYFTLCKRKLSEDFVESPTPALYTTLRNRHRARGMEVIPRRLSRRSVINDK